MKYIYYLIMVLISSHSLSKEQMPVNCKPLMVKGEIITIKTNKPAIILIHNLSNLDLWVTHPTKKDMNAGWSSKIQSGRWSALALRDKKFKLSCIESSPGHEQQVPCEGLLNVCKLPKTKFPKSENGTFWAGENLSLGALTSYLGSRGFVLPDNTQE